MALTPNASITPKQLAALIILVFSTAACGSISPTAPGNPPGGSSGSPGGTGSGSNPNGTINATIDGVAWTAGASVQTQFNNGILSIAGSDNRQLLSIAVTANRGPGTYTTGVLDPQNVVVATLSTIGVVQAWQSGPTSGSGSVTVSTLTSTSASGTFTLTLVPTPGTSATGNKVVANGSFNVTFSVAPTLPPGGAGVNGTISALVDGVGWRGSVSARAINTSGLLSITGQDIDTRLITIGLPAAVGTHSLNFANGNGANAFMNLGGQQWFTGLPGGTGTITVTSLTATRVSGAFTMAMQPSQTNTAPRVAQVMNGQFDIAF